MMGLNLWGTNITKIICKGMYYYLKRLFFLIDDRNHALLNDDIFINYQHSKE